MLSSDQRLFESVPTDKKREITLKKVDIINNRKYDINNEDGCAIFATKELDHIQWFELCNVDRTQSIARIVKEIGHHSWIVYTYKRPMFENQIECEDGYMREEIDNPKTPSLFRAYRIKWNLTRNAATLHPFVRDDTFREVRGIPGESILRICKIGKKWLPFSKENYATYEPNNAETISHWHWDNTLKSHAMKSTVSKGHNLTLHIILAILVNVVKETEKFPYLGILIG
mmetsp:Transcript_21422/g.31802  ORF Transcript_21422/g.31802 Transcript_21422/m.31802 type:complete len:229 (-) Transcript_21422:887-1573(-)